MGAIWAPDARGVAARADVFITMLPGTDELHAVMDVAIPVLLPGITLNTGPQDYRPIQKMQLQRWDGASWVRFGGLIEGADV